MNRFCEMKVKVLKLHSDGALPTRGSIGAAGYDLRSLTNETVEAGEVKLIPTGIAVQIPSGTQLEIRSRSGLAKKGIFVINSPGTVDEDYIGPVCVLLANFTKTTFLVEKGDRIAQAVLMPYFPMEFEIVEELSPTERGEGGYGSTGIK